MKSPIRTWSLLVAGFVIGTSALSAQSATGTVNASATILAVLNVTQVSDVAFGSLTPGSGASLTPGAAAGAGQTLGVLRIDHNSDVIVAASVPANLTLSGAPNLPVSFTCGYSAAVSGALDSPTSACNAIANRSGLGTGASRTSFVQVGGAILAANTVGRMPGTYTGSIVFTMTATY
jgi:hypothetical protein